MSFTLLVADESLTIQRLVQLTFAALDAHVVGVPDGPQAMAYLASSRPDIALVSVTLPQTGGFEIAQHIAREPQLRGVPVLLLAGAFDQVDEARVRESGAAGLFFKPFEPDHVINRVKELLGLSTQPDEAAAPQALARAAPPPARGAAIDTAALHFGEEWVAEELGPRGRTFEAAETSTGLPRRSSEGAEAGKPEPAVPIGPVAPVFGPADAFAALLAEEQGEPVAPVVTQPVVELSDAMVDRIADRVAERMMRGVFGESLRGTVHEVSERLVREEIQRIRASAQGRS
jgi:CheY-like chemotaxis protein